MFDAKSLLENIVRGAAPGDGAGKSAVGLEDIFRQMLPNAGNNAPAVPGESSPTAGGAFGDFFNQIQSKIGPGGGDGGIMDVLGQVLGQAVQGTREGAARISEATGTQGTIDDLIAKLPPDMVAQVKDFIANNPLAAGAAMGGLGGILLGTGTGRSLAGGAVKLGALALIGGLAYKAYQNYQSGKPLITGADGVPDAPPSGSGFDAASVTNADAELLIRAMVAAAAADGRVDDTEQATILNSLGQAGLDRDAEQFLANALNNPPTVAELATGVNSEAQAVQIYTAARLAISEDSAAETAFLKSLADALGLPPQLAAHVDATARGAA